MEQIHYLFDFDGVLADSMEIWIGIHARNLQDAGIPVPADFVETITPLGNHHGARYILSLGVEGTPESYLAQAADQLRIAYETQVLPKPHVAQALRRLKDQGIGLHVLTANGHEFVDGCLKRWQIYDLFENVWTIGDFDLTKDDPEIYRQAARRLGADVSRCTMLDDNIKAISTAKEAGLHTVGVYDYTSRSTEAAMRQTADRYILDFSQL